MKQKGGMVAAARPLSSKKPRRWPSPSSRRDLASVVRVLRGGELIRRERARQTGSGPFYDARWVQGGYGFSRAVDARCRRREKCLISLTFYA
jgi:hypothetical protein